MAIYLKLKKKPKTIDELIVELFSIYSISTRYLKATKTYKDPECKINQCCTGRYRSIDDFFEIVKTYFPKATEKEIFTELINTVIIYNGSKYYIYLMYCYVIYKPVFYFNKNIYHSDTNASNENYDDELDEYGENESKYYNWDEIINIIGLKDETALYEHLQTL